MTTIGNGFTKLFLRLVSLGKSESTITQTRFYVKPLIRRPLNVYTAKEADELHKDKGKRKKNNSHYSHRKNPSGHPGHSSGHFSNSNSSGSFYGNSSYKILKGGDESFGHVIQKARESRGNSKNPKIILEGARLITEAINAGLDIRHIFFAKKSLDMIPVSELRGGKTEIFKVKEHLLDAWSESKSSSGIIAVANQPKLSSNLSKALPVTVVLDGITDEGQLGTLIRSAVAASVARIIVSGLTDPWSPKVLRGGMGAHFYAPIMVSEWETINAYICGKSVYILNGSEKENLDNAERNSDGIFFMESENTNHLHSISYDTVTYEENSVVIIGDSKPSRAISHLIKNNEDVSSIHVQEELTPAVCGSVLLFEMKRQFEQKK